MDYAFKLLRLLSSCNFCLTLFIRGFIPPFLFAHCDTACAHFLNESHLIIATFKHITEILSDCLIGFIKRGIPTPHPGTIFFGSLDSEPKNSHHINVIFFRCFSLHKRSAESSGVEPHTGNTRTDRFPGGTHHRQGLLSK